jgi:hypothetical protein
MEIIKNGRNIQENFIPLNKSYFTTFVTSLLNIWYLDDTSMTVETLKNLLFPPEHPDLLFNQLVDYIRRIFEEVIKLGKDHESFRKEIGSSGIENVNFFLFLDKSYR